MELPDDTENLKKISEYFQSFEDTKEPGKKAYLKVSVSAINGKVWETTFELFHNKYKATKISNKCIDILFDKQNTYSSEIQANSKKNPCFSPRLESNAEGAANRITTTDLLQVLKMKLSLAHPLNKGKSIQIIDAAEINRVQMTQFRILRGGNPFYQKYGFFSDIITDIQNKIKDFKFGMMNNVTLNDGSPFINRIEEIIKKTDPTFIAEEHLEEPLIDILKKILLEQEKDSKFSSRFLLQRMFPEHNKELEEPTFHFHEESPEWQEWNQKIRIINAEYFDEPKEGGGRKKTKRTQRIKIKPLLQKARNGLRRTFKNSS